MFNVTQERESYTAAAMCRLLERSVFSDKMVFVRSVHALQYMSDTELAIYNSWCGHARPAPLNSTRRQRPAGAHWRGGGGA